jgi:ABC-type spermidine/putrescine transport system permease subunit I
MITIQQGHLVSLHILQVYEAIFKVQIVFSTYFTKLQISVSVTRGCNIFSLSVSMLWTNYLFQKQRPLLCFLYFVGRASRYKFLVINNLTHFFMYLFISCLYMFRASQRSSSGVRIVLIHNLVWLVCLSDCLVCRYDRHTKQSLTQINHTRWCINTIRTPDDERCDARNM